MYGDLIHRVDERLGTQTPFSDRIGIRTVGGVDKEVHVRLLDEHQWLLGQDRGMRGISVVLPGNGLDILIDVVSESWESTLPLRLASPDGRARIDFLDRDLWRIWRPSGIVDVEIRWEGGDKGNKAEYE